MAVNLIIRAITLAGRSNKTFQSSIGTLESYQKQVGILGKEVDFWMNEYQKVMNSTGTTSDTLGKQMAVVKGGVDSFYTSLAQGNIVGFFTNLSNVTSQAKELHGIMSDSKWTESYNKSSLEFLQKELQEHRILADDKSLSDEERMEAAKEVYNTEKKILELQKDQLNIKIQQAQAAMNLKLASLNTDTKIDDENLPVLVERYNDSEIRNKVKELASLENSLQHRKSNQKFDIGKTILDTIRNPVDALISAPFLYKKNKMIDETKEKVKQLKDEIGDDATDLVAFHNLGDEIRYSAIEAAKGQEELKIYDRQINKIEESIKKLGKTNQSSKSNSITQKIPALPPPPVDLNLNDEINRIFEKNSLQANADFIFEIPIQLGDFEDESIPATGTSLNELNEKLNSLREAYNMAETDFSRSLFATQIEEVQELIEEYDVLNKQTEESTDRFAQLFEMSGAMGDLFGGAGAAIQQFAAEGSAAEMAAKSLAMAQHGLAFATGIANAAAMPFPMNIIAIATTVASLVSAFGSVGLFANGGIVGGNSFTGDRMLARVNSGEMILNRAQQSNLFEMVNHGSNYSSSPQLVVLDTRIKGRDIEITGRNYRKVQNKLG